MKKNILAAAIAVVAGSSQAELMITGVIDGPSSSPKAIEFYATAAIADLSQYTIKMQSNGNTGATYSKSYTFEATSVEVGTFITLNYETDAAGFLSYFDVAPTYSDSGINFNGDDRVLIVSTADETNIIDIFGEMDTNGSGRDWEYTDGWAYRKSAYADSGLTMAPNGGTFDSSAWNYSGVDALDGKSKNTFSGVVMPVAGVIPEVTSGTCGETATLISSIQGNVGHGEDSPILGQNVIVEAIVTQNNQAGLTGYFIQEEDADSDGEAATSEGIFVYGDKESDISVGDKVRFASAVSEFRGVTQLSGVTDLKICESNVALPTPASLTLPVASLDEFEQVEGMQVSITNNMVVSDFYGTSYSFRKFGQFVVSTELQIQPNEVAEPSVEAYNAAVAARRLNSIMLEDGLSTTNPETIAFPNAQGFSNTNYFRVGFGVSNIVGAMHGYDSGSTVLPYYIVPATTPTFDPLDADRTLEPEVDASADLKIASMNVLNLFNGIKLSDIVFPGIIDRLDEQRGAQSQEDYEIQLAKIVTAIEAIDADVIGLMEIENDGFDENSTIYDLITAVNATQPESSQYEYVNPGTSKIGDDAISVGLLYRPSVVRLMGTTTILDSDNSPVDGDGFALFLDTKNRPSLIQSFQHKETGDLFTVSINHLKSKSSSCSSLGDPNLNDGQGNCNITRTNAVKALTQFMATNPTGVETDNVIFMGDMNAYSKEDPIVAFENAGYTNLKYTDKSTEEQPYSYSFSGFLGSLDQVMGSSGMVTRLLSIDDWHINSVESGFFDYDTDLDQNNSNDHYASIDPYYSSDHDPVIAGFKMVKVDGYVNPDAVQEEKDSDNNDDDDNGGSLGFLMLPILLGLLRLRRNY